MIHFTTGKPRAGKGLFVMAEIIRELRFGSRVIVTDLPVKLDPWLRVFVSGVSWDPSPALFRNSFGRSRSRSSVQVESGLVAYLISNFGSDFGVRQRLRILSESEAKEFYLVRCRRSDNEWITLDHKRDPKNNSVESFSTEIPTHPTVYITDECWRTFPSREWQTTGKGVVFYAAQHAKLGDDWYLTTQHTNQIEKQLRDLAQDFSVIKNMANRRVAMFRGPSIFTVSVYDRPPNGVMIEPMSVSTFRLDKKGIGACYDTAAGSGVIGQGADIGQKKKGLPFAVIIVGVLCVIGLLIASPKIVSYALAKYMGPAAPVPVAATVATNAPGAFSVGKVAEALVSGGKACPVATGALPEPLQFCGTFSDGKVTRYFLSDGSVRILRSQFQELPDGRVFVDGQIYSVKRADHEAALAFRVPDFVPGTRHSESETIKPGVSVSVIGRRESAVRPLSSIMNYERLPELR
jgi:hypothetical protein